MRNQCLLMYIRIIHGSNDLEFKGPFIKAQGLKSKMEQLASTMVQEASLKETIIPNIFPLKYGFQQAQYAGKKYFGIKIDDILESQNTLNRTKYIKQKRKEKKKLAKFKRKQNQSAAGCVPGPPPS